MSWDPLDTPGLLSEHVPHSSRLVSRSDIGCRRADRALVGRDDMDPDDAPQAGPRVNAGR
jgi:hypothetical protein